MRFWCPSELRSGVKDWKEITPEPFQKAVGALRRGFELSAWKAGEIMREGCYPALHRSVAGQTGVIVEALKKIGCPALPSVDGGQTEPAVFMVYFDVSAGLLAKEVSRVFSELLEIASPRLTLLASREPPDWASLEVKVLVADQSHGIPLWTRDACDKQSYDPLDSSDEIIHWRKWRAPRWFFMKPFGNCLYDRAQAWERMDEEESKCLLEFVEDRFNQRLITALEKTVDETHVRLAKQFRQVPPSILTRGESPSRIDLPHTDSDALTSKAHLWRDFHNRFMQLAREEQGRADVITKGMSLRSMDQLLHAHCNYREHPQGWEKGKPEQGEVCLLHTPPHGVWNTSDGISENFRERVRLCVAEAGRALPDYPNGADSEDFWLHRLYLDLLENNSDSLFCASKEGGVILSVCVASATFCTRLQREALTHAEPKSYRGATMPQNPKSISLGWNLGEGILKKKARIAEIERILSRPPITEYQGRTVHGGRGWRRTLEEERQHLIIAVGELEVEAHRGTGLWTKGTENSEHNVANSSRRAMVDAYLQEVLRKTGKRITRADLWKAAGYQSRTEFERWQREDEKHPNNAAHANFLRVLREKPHLK